MDRNTSVLELKGIGEKTQKLLEKLDIHCVGDLLAHYPRDYDLYEEPVKIAQACPGSVCAVYVTVVGIPNERRVRSLHILNVDVSDSSGTMQLTFFNMPFLKKVLKQGGYYLFRGTVQARGSRKIMEQPKLFPLEEYRKQEGCLIPEYALTKGLTNQTLRKAVKQALERCEFEEEYYPPELLTACGLIPERAALETLHFPREREGLLEARRRLVFDEFFSFLYLLRRNRQTSEGLKNRFRMFETADTVRFLERLPFPLTNAQKRVWQEIKNDMGSPVCMNRLIQGDVG